MINSWTLLIVKATDNKHVSKLFNLTPLLIANILQKAACKNSKTYKSYDYFKMVYKHDAENDVAKTSQLCQNGVFFSKNMFKKLHLRL